MKIKDTSVVAIIPVKGDSLRFPKKNLKILKGEPLFWHSIKCIFNCKNIKEIYVATDSLEVKKYCLKKRIKIIWRGPNKKNHEEQFFDVVKYAYGTLDKSYQYVISVLANSPEHKTPQVDESIKMIKTNKFQEVRSYNEKGEETGLFAFRSFIFEKRFEISNHLGAIKSDSKEIHYKKEFQQLKKRFKKN
jgi:CMP-N,N'-diacetyllegionaminic acid synthase